MRCALLFLIQAHVRPITGVCVCNPCACVHHNVNLIMESHRRVGAAAMTRLSCQRAHWVRATRGAVAQTTVWTPARWHRFACATCARVCVWGGGRCGAWCCCCLCCPGYCEYGLRVTDNTCAPAHCSCIAAAVVCQQVAGGAKAQDVLARLAASLKPVELYGECDVTVHGHTSHSMCSIASA